MTTMREARYTPTPGEDADLAEVLAELGIATCACGHAIGWGDLEWGQGQTEAGTSYVVLDVICSACHVKVLAAHQSWHPWVEEPWDLLAVLGDEAARRAERERYRLMDEARAQRELRERGH